MFRDGCDARVLYNLIAQLSALGVVSIATCHPFYRSVPVPFFLARCLEFSSTFFIGMCPLESVIACDN